MGYKKACPGCGEWADMSVHRCSGKSAALKDPGPIVVEPSVIDAARSVAGACQADVEANGFPPFAAEGVPRITLDEFKERLVALEAEKARKRQAKSASQKRWRANVKSKAV